jgi:predicted dinucleotide-binding enzyme
MDKQKVGIIGDGNVGGALKKGIERSGRQVRASGRDKGAVQQVAAWGELVILAVPFAALDEVVANAREQLAGKVVVDVTNPLDNQMNLAVGFDSSGAEQLQKKLPRSKVVKAFNTVFAVHMSTGKLGTQRLTCFAAGDDVGARRAVVELARDIGFDPVDAGPLKNARLLEPMANFNIQLGFGLGMGTEIGFELVHR